MAYIIYNNLKLKDTTKELIIMTNIKNNPLTSKEKKYVGEIDPTILIIQKLIE